MEIFLYNIFIGSIALTLLTRICGLYQKVDWLCLDSASLKERKNFGFFRRRSVCDRAGGRLLRLPMYYGITEEEAAQ